MCQEDPATHLTTAQAARLLGVTPAVLLAMVNDGLVPAVRTRNGRGPYLYRRDTMQGIREAIDRARAREATA